MLETAKNISSSHPDKTEIKAFLNREFEWLQFNKRVFKLASEIPTTPLLEQVNFYNIYLSNLDEFFMKRVGGLKRQHLSSLSPLSMDGLTAEEQLENIHQAVIEQTRELTLFFKESLAPKLEEQKIFLLSWKQLSVEDQTWAEKYFNDNIFPVLTPMAVDEGHPFPLVTNLSLFLAIALKHPKENELQFATLKLPKLFPRWIQLPGLRENGYRFINILDLVTAELPHLFPNMTIEKTMAYRVTRNIEMSGIEDEDAEDLLELIVEEVKQRKFAEIVRLQHEPNPDPWLLAYLKKNLEIEDRDLYQEEYSLAYYDLSDIFRLDLPKLKYTPWKPLSHPALADANQNMFSIIKKQDILVHHPYQSFSSSVERFISQAADDPQVIAIKITLYRTDKEGSIANALIKAADNGKQVVALIELKARMEEEKNIHLAKKLEDQGVHVVYGVLGLKTHAKLALVIRKEDTEVTPYLHLSSGNYNSTTARIYEDFSFFTANPAITRDAVELFHYLTGRSLKDNFKSLLVAPINLRQKILEYIQEETRNVKKGLPAEIILKCNNLQDKSIIEALYKASSAGVPIQLIIRGFSCLRPGIPGMSENIKINSILGRFLEHSRLYYFRRGTENPEQGTFLMGSADLMSRNLYGRVEVLVPIKNKQLKTELWQKLNILCDKKLFSWTMKEDGLYHPQIKMSASLKTAQEKMLIFELSRN